MNRWAGKVAIVTGASAGIGEAISRALVKESVKVVGLARRQDKLQELTEELGKDKFIPVVCDIQKEEDIVKAFKWIDEKLGGAHILINNAGVSDISKIIDTSTEKYRRVLDTNVIAPAVCAREAIQSMKKRGVDGHIVNISSMAGHCAEMIKIPLGMYSASKYALTALAVELRHELSLCDLNIKITNISPGAVMTDMLKNAFEQLNLGTKNMPVLRSTDIADAVIYVLGTSPVVEVSDILLSPIHSDRLSEVTTTEPQK